MDNNSLAASLGKRQVTDKDIQNNQILAQLKLDAERKAWQEANSGAIEDATGQMLTAARAPGLAAELTQWGRAAIPASIGRKDGIAAIAPILNPASVAKAYVENQVVDLPPISPSALVAQGITTITEPSKIK